MTKLISQREFRRLGRFRISNAGEASSATSSFWLIGTQRCGANMLSGRLPVLRVASPSHCAAWNSFQKKPSFAPCVTPRMWVPHTYWVNAMASVSCTAHTLNASCLGIVCALCFLQAVTLSPAGLPAARICFVAAVVVALLRRSRVTTLLLHNYRIP